MPLKEHGRLMRIGDVVAMVGSQRLPGW